MGYNLLINGVYWGYNPLTNLLLTSWDILVPTSTGPFTAGFLVAINRIIHITTDAGAMDDANQGGPPSRSVKFNMKLWGPPSQMCRFGRSTPMTFPYNSGQISSRPHTTDFPQMVVKSKGNPLSGKSRLVKYYNLPRI